MDQNQVQLVDAVKGIAPLIPPMDTSTLNQAAKLADAVSTITAPVQEALADSSLQSVASSLSTSQVSGITNALDISSIKLPDYTLSRAYESLTPNYTIPDHSVRSIDPSSYFKPNWRQLIILGNGFDLQCGLQSRFGDFFRTRFERISNIKSYDQATWKQLLEDSDLTLWDFILEANIDDAWCDVEGEMEKWVLSAAGPKSKSSLFWGAHNRMKEFPFTDRMSVIVMSGNRLESEVDNRDYLFGNIARYVWTLCPEVHTEGRTANLFIGLLKRDLRRLERAFGDYLSNEIAGNNEYSEKCRNLYRIIDEDGKQSEDDFYVSTSVLSFNYTSLIEDCFDKGEDGVFVNIHGKLGEDIIFGIDGKDCMDNPIAVPFTKTYRLMQCGGSRTNGLISTANSSNLQDATDIIKFYGHSLGKADYSYFQSIFDGVDLYESETVLVFYFPINRSNGAEIVNNEWRTRLANSINDLLVAYGATMDNSEHGKNLMHKLLLEGRLIIRGLPVG